MRNMLVIPDLHKRMQDISTLKGYRRAGNAVMEDIFKTVEERQITDIQFLGDVFDSGYSSEVNLALVDVDQIKKLRDMVNGNMYNVIGNHINIKMSSNPELFLIQPHDKYKIRESESIKEQILKTPEYMEIEGVNFYLMHYDWHENSSNFNIDEYKPKLKNNGNMNVAFYHTNYIAPSRYCKFSKVSDTKLQELFEGLDMVICGHIHQPINPFYIGTTLVWIPGSLTNTVSVGMHSHINLPILHLENGKCDIDMIQNFSLHTDLITVKEAKTVAIKKIDSKLDVDLSDQDIQMRMMKTLDWLKFNSDNSSYDIDLCNMIYNEPTNIDNLVNVFSSIKTISNINVIK